MDYVPTGPDELHIRNEDRLRVRSVTVTLAGRTDLFFDSLRSTSAIIGKCSQEASATVVAEILKIQFLRSWSYVCAVTRATIFPCLSSVRRLSRKILANEDGHPVGS